MPTSFLLRFQEPAVEGDGKFATCGTRTATRIRGEQPDPDPGEASVVTIPRSVTPFGDVSLKKFRSGGGESDDAAGSNEVSLTKWSAGTRTVTNVRAEVDDKDPGKTSMRMVPRCSSS